MGTPTCHSISFYLILFHLTALLPLSIPQSTHTNIVNSCLNTTANHSLNPSSSIYFHEQRKWPMANGTTFWKPCQSARPTSQWQSSLTSSDLYKISHLTSESPLLNGARQEAPGTWGWVRASAHEFISHGRTSCCRQLESRTNRWRGGVRGCTGRARRPVSAKWAAQAHSHGFGPVRIRCLIRDNQQANV